MSVTFEKCSFLNNEADDGTVLIEGGSATFKQCEFYDNKGVSYIYIGTIWTYSRAIAELLRNFFMKQGWPIELQLNSTGTVDNSCFIGNPGPVFAYRGSELVSQTQNFAYDNNDDGYDCEGCWSDQLDECIRFTETSCLSNIDISAIYSAGIRLQVSTVVMVASLVFTNLMFC